MNDFETIGVKRFFNGHIKDGECVLKQEVFDFIVQEMTPTRLCGILPIVDHKGFLEGKEVVGYSEGLSIEEKEQRTIMHKKLKCYPFVKAKTIGGKICLEHTDEDVYSFVLQKVMFNTIDAGKWICKRLGVPDNAFQFAGNKDKRAVTFQEVTVQCSFMKLYKLAVKLNKEENSFEWEDLIGEGYSRESIEEENRKVEEEILKIKGISSEEWKEELERSWPEERERIEKPLDRELAEWERFRSSIKIFDIKKSSVRKLGDLKGNRFSIALRGFKDKGLIENLERGFLNYFGQQRFGNKLKNHEIGYEILTKKYEEAVNKIMKGGKCYELYIDGKYEEAMSLGDGVEKYILKCKSKGIKEKDMIYGLRRELRMLYLHSYQSLKFNEAINSRMEYGTSVVEGDMVYVDGEVKAVENPSEFSIFDVVLPLEKFNNKMLKGGYRKIVEKANNVIMTEFEDRVVVKFFLNSSCYATMALREVIGNSVLNKVSV
ncbi:pseudouridine synthase-like protein [Encephalitozoon intestinalis ATCC 50506]|uniref:Pseudouridine synthase-like protein n=1 Tax=Encephalitozoon intestinalis (strain ATCC 50506) TaxID=876142 RepID=E0S7P5_ENCIT|nr:pseudouridine synthase-like protein [Encephalitozoon intestinalis ATCC 50506]ADM11724.1 pseudouridine synthase-like protein [Encephalitozoon intestinalis ATCC 50506]UTX45463.1 pseudouridylate synthase 7-like protein [Encephalitozoon intestinalis]